MTAVRNIYAYTHVHWDREWYRSFESFRLQLLQVVVELCDELEAGRLSKFYLDGQSVIIEDLLQLRPELATRLENLIRSGKLYCGPWYVMPDEMLVSGESLIRNIACGIAGASKFGAAAMIGYCPDTFGHTQDLPRIFNGFGIKTAILWRGAPRLEMGPAFWWRSPDGSCVLAYHLTRGYYRSEFQTLACSTQGMDELEKFVRGYVDGDGIAANTVCDLVNGVLMPVGGDHTSPPANFLKSVKDINKRLQKSGAQAQIIPTGLSEFLSALMQAAQKTQLEQTVEGELRFNRWAPQHERAYLLQGTLSTRLYLKRANRLLEHAIVNLCEPLSAFAALCGFAQYPDVELEHCWKLLLRNQPHDSICGCCADDVHRQDMARYEQTDDVVSNLIERAAIAIAGQPEQSALSSLDPAFGCDKVAVLNTSSSPCAAPVPLKWMRHLDDKSPLPPGCQIEKRGKIDKLFSFFVGVPYYKEVEQLEGWVWPGEVPPLGSKLLDWKTEQPSSETRDLVPPVAARGRKLSNGLLELFVSGDGKITVSHTVPGQLPRTYKINHALRDVGDGGDTYNFDPIPDDKPITARFAGVETGRGGPLVGSLILTYEFDLPQSAVEDHSLVKYLGMNLGKIQLLKRSSKRIKQTVKVEMSLRRGVPIVFFDASFNNAACDHRLEVVFDTESEVRTSFSENHFSLVQRHHGGLPEKLPVAQWHEAALDRFPCQRFFIANGQLFLNKGLPEYAVDGSNVAITLLRAVSWLSKPQLFTRGGGAGPNLPVPEANCLGPNQASYGWAPLGAGKQVGGGQDAVSAAVTARAYELAELFAGCLWAGGTRRNDLPEGSLVNLDNRHVRVMSMFMDNGDLILRCLNVTGEPQVVNLALKRGRFSSASRIALSGATQADVAIKNSACALELGPSELCSIRLSLRKRR